MIFIIIFLSHLREIKTTTIIVNMIKIFIKIIVRLQTDNMVVLVSENSLLRRPLTQGLFRSRSVCAQRMYCVLYNSILRLTVSYLKTKACKGVCVYVLYIHSVNCGTVKVLAPCPTTGSAVVKLSVVRAPVKCNPSF